MLYQNTFATNIADRPLPEEKKDHFSILAIGSIDDNNVASPLQFKRSSSFELLIINKGFGKMWIDSTNYEVSDNQLCIILPGQYRCFQCDRSTKGYLLSFSADFLFAGVARMYCISWCEGVAGQHRLSVILGDDETQREISVLLKKMMKEFEGDHLFRKEVLSGLLNILLIDISRNLPGEHGKLMEPRDGQLTNHFTRLVKSNYITQKQVCEYAALLYVSPSYLNTVIKKTTGYTAKHHIQQQILSEAKRVLVAKGSMKETAYHLGFDDPAHFSKFFKKNAGMNFKNYRKSFL